MDYSTKKSWKSRGAEKWVNMKLSCAIYIQAHLRCVEAHIWRFGLSLRGRKKWKFAWLLPEGRVIILSSLAVDPILSHVRLSSSIQCGMSERGLLFDIVVFLFFLFMQCILMTHLEQMLNFTVCMKRSFYYRPLHRATLLDVNLSVPSALNRNELSISC